MKNILGLSVISILLLSGLLAACTPSATPQATGVAPVAPTAPPDEPPSQVSPTVEPSSPPPPVDTPKPIKLKVVVLPYLAYAPFFIAQEEGFYTEQGLEVEIIRMDKAGEFTAAIAQGQIDVVADIISVGSLNAIAQGSKIKYVADKGYFDPNGCDYTGWAVRKDLLESGVLDDLKNVAGMKVASSSATTIEFFFDTLVKDVGLSSKDVELINLPPADRLSALETGAIDIASVAEPWIARIKNTGIAEMWHPIQKDFPNFAFSVMMYGPNLLEKNPEAGKRFMVAYLKAVQVYNEGKTDRNVEIISKYTELKPEEVKQVCWQPIKSDGMVNIQSVLDFQDWAIAKGYQMSAVTEEQLWDPSFIEYAVEQLK
jgi:NitT/TauT family transport system substrate-binding protein